MTHEDRVALLGPGVDRADGAWADLGAGTGAFTFALAALLGPSAVIHAVDRDPRALRALQRDSGPLQGGGRGPRITCVTADFARELPLPLPLLDGVLAANALHFHADACGILRRAAERLKPGGVLIVVEYDIARPNRWVPHPLPWSRFPQDAACAGLSGVRLLGTRTSAYHGSMYAASCTAGGSPRG